MFLPLCLLFFIRCSVLHVSFFWQLNKCKIQKTTCFCNWGNIVSLVNNRSDQWKFVFQWLMWIKFQILVCMCRFFSKPQYWPSHCRQCSQHNPEKASETDNPRVCSWIISEPDQNPWLHIHKKSYTERQGGGVAAVHKKENENTSFSIPDYP